MTRQAHTLQWSENRLVLVDAATQKRYPLGRSDSKLTPKKEHSAPLEDLFLRLLDAALERFQRPSLDLCRLVFGGQDGFPGLLIDRYGSVIRIETYHSGYHPWIQDIQKRVQARLHATQWVHVHRPSDGNNAVVKSSAPDVPVAHVVKESGLRFLVRTKTPDAVGTGIFLDQRIGRRWVREQSSGKTVLNLFAHAGAFGVAAACGGARRVDHVDQARKCATWSACNLALNGYNPRAHRFIVDDAFGFLRRQAKKQTPQYGIIICDPPTTAFIRKKERFVARDHLSSLAEQCFRALEPKGYLLLSCNHRQLSWDAIENACHMGAAEAGKQIHKLRQLSFGDDFPLDQRADAPPTKGFWVQLK